MQLTFWQKARYWVLLLFIVLVTISSHPRIVDISHASGITSGTILSSYIILAFFGLFVMCINVKSMFRLRMIQFCWFTWILIVLFAFITMSFYNNSSMLSYAITIAVCLVAIMIGWQLNMDEKRYNIVLIAFASLILYVGLMQVFLNVGGFVILDLYETDNKNALGVMLATGSIIYLIVGLNSNAKPIVQLLLYGLSILTFVVILTIRARAAALSVGLLVVYVLYERFKGKNFLFILLGGLMVATLAFIVLPETIKQFVYSSFFQNFEGGDITSGRMDRNRAAMEFLSHHMMVGNLDQNVSIGWIHNYPLNKLFEFGVVFSFPIMLLYIFLLIKTIVKTIRSDSHNNYVIGYYLLLIPFIISMAEPTFPFGPGTATVFNFIVFGAALRHSYNSKYALHDVKINMGNSSLYEV